MVKKKTTKKKKSPKKKANKNTKKYPTLNLKTEQDIARDFAVKITKKFNKIIKSVILFGSVAKKEQTRGSDIDIVIVIDDVTIKWDQELIAWYREELDKILKSNPYNKKLHINTIKLTTWWEDLIRGDPIIINLLRNGEAMVDMAGFYNPLKVLLLRGKIKPSPEAIHACLQRAPYHLTKSNIAELGAVEGVYWSMVDSAHAALIANKVSPPSPEHIPRELKINLVNKGMLKSKYLEWFREILNLHKEIEHNKISSLKGEDIDKYQERAEEFMEVMAKIVNRLID